MRRFTIALLALTVAAPMATAGDRESKAARAESDRGKRGESEEILERVRLYLQRHGDHGRIDPAARSKRVAVEYAYRVARKRESLGIGGNTWMSIGPTNGAGRINGLAVHPTSAGTLYAGAAGGGLWKTTNAGTNWIPLTDDINDLSVGAVALAPSSPNIIYLGTGEPVGSSSFGGIGLLKSTDGGATWLFPASVVSSSFYRISVHPTNPMDLVIATSDGGFRSLDGGSTWTLVIPSIVTDVVRDPTNASVLFAASGGRVLKSTDGGGTWLEKSAGLTLTYNRVALAISPSNPMVIYAATALGGPGTSHIFKSTNGGDLWNDLPGVASSGMSYYHYNQVNYDNTIVVSPTNADVVLAGGVAYIRSTDGGLTFSSVLENPDSGNPHVDVHDLQYQGSTLWVANDGGVWSSADDGVTYSERNAALVTRQYYAIANDPTNRSRMLGGTQDNGTDQRGDNGGTFWTNATPGDGFDCGFNPFVPAIAYATVQYGEILRLVNVGTAEQQSQTITPEYRGDGNPFYTQLVMDPSAPNVLYTASVHNLFRSTNGGDSWDALPLWPNVSWVGVIAVARSNGSVLMVAGQEGSATGVYRSTNGGSSWARAAGGLPAGGWPNDLEIDPRNPLVAYAAFPSISGSLYMTSNGGESWVPRSTGLPAFAAQVVRVDPTDSTVLYCGTDVGLYRSTDQGGTWAEFGVGLPNSSVHDLAILEDGTVLRVATHGRGVWELQIPPTGNTPPVAVISTPSNSAIVVVRGTTIAFSGSVSDPDPNDSVTALWTFSDSWEMTRASSGASSAQHTFYRAGLFAASLTAIDNHAAMANKTISVTVAERQDDCATPIVIPGSGPFPYTIRANNIAASPQASDPSPSCLGWGGSGGRPTLWLEFTPAVSGTYELSACGLDFGLSVFTGPACGPYSEVDCLGYVSCSSALSVSATAGQTLRVLVSTLQNPAAGGNVITVTLRPITGASGAPRVTGSSRPAGPSAGNTNLVVYGANFENGAAVSFGGVAATSITRLDGTKLAVTTPAHPSGMVDVSVSNPDSSIGTLRDGYLYEYPSVTRLMTIAPCRLFDTRNAVGSDAASPALAPGETRVFSVEGRCAVPSQARAISVNQTVTAAAAGGELVIYRGDLVAATNSTNVSYTAGRARANNGILELARDGSGTFKVFNKSSGMVHFILDANGYFQ